jgi:predicted site-specific integrase-resolvase
MKPSPTALPTSRDLCVELSISYQTMCAWSKAGKVPAIRMPDGSWRYRRAEIDAWLADRSNRA